MKQFTHISGLMDYLASKREAGLTIGFVPTMGALHAGHLDLVSRSIKETGLTVCSIFVNPIQFNNKADLEKYPRPLAQDLAKLEETGCDVVFVPETGEMYPEGEKYSVDLDFGMLDQVMEGKFRPGHFMGVAVVVKKLFDIVTPDVAYFGKKDFQQLAIITHMVNALKIQVKIVPCETIREPDGLAMSSRNVRLTEAERKAAPEIYRVLLNTREQTGKMPVHALKEWAVRNLQNTPGFSVEYFEIGDKETLMPVNDWNSRERAVAFVAVFLGDVRLIDNIELFS